MTLGGSCLSLDSYLKLCTHKTSPCKEEVAKEAMCVSFHMDRVSKEKYNVNRNMNGRASKLARPFLWDEMESSFHNDEMVGITSSENNASFVEYGYAVMLKCANMLSKI